MFAATRSEVLKVTPTSRDTCPVKSVFAVISSPSELRSNSGGMLEPVQLIDIGVGAAAKLAVAAASVDVLLVALPCLSCCVLELDSRTDL